MPTFLRSASLSSFSSFTSCPSTVIEPESMVFSALMHRISVDLPEPDGPMMHTTWPFMTSKLTPFRTSSDPKDLRTSLSETSGWPGSQFGSTMTGPPEARASP